MTFDEQVAALRKTVTPKQTKKKKPDCTAEEWAAALEYRRLYYAAWNKAHPEKVACATKKYYESHRQQKRDYHREYERQRCRGDVRYRLRKRLRTRLYIALRSAVRGSVSQKSQTVQLLGCTIGELQKHLELQFLPGMSWENWGKGSGKWNIDHVYPLSAADLTDERHAKAVCHYTNLRPMWEADNVRKSDSVRWEELVSHYSR